MSQRDEELSSKWGTICTPLQMLAPDGKMRKIQSANAKEPELLDDSEKEESK